MGLTYTVRYLPCLTSGKFSPRSYQATILSQTGWTVTSAGDGILRTWEDGLAVWERFEELYVEFVDWVRLLDWERWGRHCNSRRLRLLPRPGNSRSLCSGFFLHALSLVLQISIQSCPYLESCQTVWSNFLDIDFHLDYIGDTFLLSCGQNWNFILWDPDHHGGNNPLSI